jgi:hypothetical protein
MQGKKKVKKSKNKLPDFAGSAELKKTRKEGGGEIKSCEGWQQVVEHNL